MSRNILKVLTLHGFTIEELIELRNSSKEKRAILVLTIVIMRYHNASTPSIMGDTGVSKVTVAKYINLWNKQGTKSLKDLRGGSEGNFTAEMEDDLIYTATHRTPNQCGFVAFNWSCQLLAEYIYQNYGIKYSGERIRLLLHKNRISYKRSQPKPTKADKNEQEIFKKNVRNTAFFRVRR